MADSESRPLLARRRFARLVRQVGWAVFWAGAAWTFIGNTMSNRVVIAPLVVGVVVLGLTQLASRLLKRYRDRLRSEGRLPARSSHRLKPLKRSAAASAPQPTVSDYERGGATGYEKPAGRSRLFGRPALGSAASEKGSGMRRVKRVLVYTAVALPIVALALLWMVSSDQPLVVQRADLSMDNYEKAQQLIESHDPRTARGGNIRTIVASQDEVNVVLNFAAKRFHNASTRVALKPGAAFVQASVPVRGNPFGSWLNIDAVLRETEGMPTVDKLKVGSLPVPAFVADFVLARAMDRFAATEKGSIAKDMVKNVALLDSQVRIVYEWRADLVDRARAALISKDDQERFRAYSDRLVQAVDSAGRAQSISVSQLLPPMFQLARQRSTQGDAAKENRAAIITLAFFAFGRDLSAIIPAASSWRAPVPLTVTLYGRDDTAQHFLVSAALAVEGGSPLSNAIGVYREVDDSRRTGTGKGFSFQDIAADKAGTRFGTIAAKSPKRLQDALAVGIKDSDFMPPFSDLAEEIPEAEFKRRYGGVGSPKYNEILADIDARVARTPLLR